MELNYSIVYMAEKVGQSESTENEAYEKPILIGSKMCNCIGG
jgi:hypothetical protein